MAQKKRERPGIYDFLDYRAFIKAWIDSAAKQRGQLARLSESANIHKTTLSQILKGAKDLSLEQAHRVARFLELNAAETEYFLLLVNYSRAGSADLKEAFRSHLQARQKSQQQLLNRVTKTRELTAEERAIYYSNWTYSAVRNVTAIESFQHPGAIARRLGLDASVVSRVLEFLLKNGLCVMEKGRLAPGPKMTHLEADSPLVARHHGNWRIKAMERHPMLQQESELAYTAPMTLSASDVLRIRALLADLVQKTDEIVGPSPSEKLYCMCLDWFEIK